MLDHYGWKNWAKLLSMVVLIGSVCLLNPGNVSAQRDFKTFITFDSPIEVSGSSPQVLPAGTYTFKLVGSQSNRNIVQITNEAETHVFTVILAVPATREAATDRTVLTFETRALDAPQALGTWFAPNRTDGLEFVYPKLKATELARGSDASRPSGRSAN